MENPNRNADYYIIGLCLTATRIMAKNIHCYRWRKRIGHLKQRGSASVNQTCSWGDYPQHLLVLNRIRLLLEMKQLLDGSWHFKQQEEKMGCLMLNHGRKLRTLNTPHTPGPISQVYSACQSRRGKGQLMCCTNVCSSLADRSIWRHA